MIDPHNVPLVEADERLARFIERGLSVEMDPVTGQAGLPDNPNHANVIGWPNDKAQQKRLALQIAKDATLVRPPDR